MTDSEAPLVTGGPEDDRLSAEALEGVEDIEIYQDPVYIREGSE